MSEFRFPVTPANRREVSRAMLGRHRSPSRQAAWVSARNSSRRGPPESHESPDHGAEKDTGDSVRACFVDGTSRHDASVCKLAGEHALDGSREHLVERIFENGDGGPEGAQH